ncbi:MAG: hypothetical protein LBK12_05050 [Odoribacteraceae bacterium]|nr:hypothetical protein [Odoribacteraceae bacterium]
MRSERDEGVATTAAGGKNQAATNTTVGAAGGGERKSSVAMLATRVVQQGSSGAEIETPSGASSYSISPQQAASIPSSVRPTVRRIPPQ